MKATLSVLDSVEKGTAGQRFDLPPNKGGHSYTEFRDRAGKVTAVILTDFLERQRAD